MVAGFGWFFLVCCCFSALFCTGSALDGSLAGWDSAEIAFVIIGTAALNAVAIGFIALGKPENLAALFPTVAAGPTLPGSLGNRFRLFGNVTGRTRAEITSAVGRPVAVTAMATNTVIQWSERGYQIALFFDGSTDGALCQGIASEIGI